MALNFQKANRINPVTNAYTRPLTPPQSVVVTPEQLAMRRDAMLSFTPPVKTGMNQPLPAPFTTPKLNQVSALPRTSLPTVPLPTKPITEPRVGTIPNFSITAPTFANDTEALQWAQNTLSPDSKMGSLVDNILNMRNVEYRINPDGTTSWRSKNGDIYGDGNPWRTLPGGFMAKVQQAVNQINNPPPAPTPMPRISPEVRPRVQPIRRWAKLANRLRF